MFFEYDDGDKLINIKIIQQILIDHNVIYISTNVPEDCEIRLNSDEMDRLVDVLRSEGMVI